MSHNTSDFMNIEMDMMNGVYVLISNKIFSPDLTFIEYSFDLKAT